MLETLSYQATLDRGYAVVRAGDALVTSRDTAAGAPQLDIQFADGHVTAVPTDPAPRKPRKTVPKLPDQGSLF